MTAVGRTDTAAKPETTGPPGTPAGSDPSVPETATAAVTPPSSLSAMEDRTGVGRTDPPRETLRRVGHLRVERRSSAKVRAASPDLLEVGVPVVEERRHPLALVVGAEQSAPEAAFVTQARLLTGLVGLIQRLLGGR